MNDPTQELHKQRLQKDVMKFGTAKAVGRANGVSVLKTNFINLKLAMYPRMNINTLRHDARELEKQDRLLARCLELHKV